MSRRHAKRHPKPDEVFLFAEVADSSLSYDLQEKRRAYAASGIREFWISNRADDVLEVNRQPEGTGYREVTTISADGSASPLAFPDVTIAPRDIIPPR
jgi:Uma2 family endonuclease